MDIDTTLSSVLFRPAKRRKFQRARHLTEDGDIHAELASSETGACGARDDSSDEPAFTEILRQRKTNRSRRQGIEFSPMTPNAVTESSTSNSLTVTAPQVARLRTISDRFVGHTGQVVDVDKHMMAYIDSEMTKRRLGQNLPTSKPNSNSVHTSESESDGYEESTDDKRVAQRHPASLGKIHEIDLGADASLRNVERTETAIRRAQNAEPLPDQDDKPLKPRKPRMGRDGKPMKPRPRKRRNSEDIKRDQLVEQVLRESRLEIYDEPAETTLGDTNNGDLDTDERIAEQFRQDFMDAMESRQRNRTAGQPKMPLGKPGEVGPKGPKLGGSRSARAAMRERELAEQQKGKR